MTTEQAINEIVSSGYGQVQCHEETMRMAVDALRAQQERENIIRDIKADMKPDDTYSVALVLELLGDEQNQPADTDSTPCFPGQSAHREARP